MKNICGKFYWDSSTKYRDIASRKYVLTDGQRTDGRLDDQKHNTFGGAGGIKCIKMYKKNDKLTCDCIWLSSPLILARTSSRRSLSSCSRWFSRSRWSRRDFISVRVLFIDSSVSQRYRSNSEFSCSRIFCSSCAIEPRWVELLQFRNFSFSSSINLYALVRRCSTSRSCYMSVHTHTPHITELGLHRISLLSHTVAMLQRRTIANRRR